MKIFIKTLEADIFVIALFALLCCVIKRASSFCVEELLLRALSAMLNLD